MLQYDHLWQNLPPSAELPGSDDTPVDTEGQNTIPNLLLAALLLLWANRLDWFFAVDMGLYHTAGKDPRVPVVPDALLALNVPRRKGETWRSNYVVWEEGVPPIWVLEMVSQTYNQEYSAKLDLYAQIGILYYVIYNPFGFSPRRRPSDPLEVYRLVNGVYQRVFGDPVWMPEIELGIGQGTVLHGGIEISCLFWFDQEGQRHPIPEEALQTTVEQLERERQRADQAEQRAGQAEQRAGQAEQRAGQAEQQREQERQRAERAEQRAGRLEQLLRAQGIEPIDPL